MPPDSSQPHRQPSSPSERPTASQAPSRPDPAAFSAAPTHIGQYVVRRLIASGGMGDVYECFDERLGTTVAVKVAHPELAGRPDVLEQIRAEARRLASVKDKRFVCRVLSAGDVTIRGVAVPYVSMEYEPEAETLGGPLSNAWPMARKVECFIDICTAVQSLHEQHLVHADIKPSNILVVRDEPRLIDFGIARVVRKLGGERGQPVAGTPGYLDPAVLREGVAPDQRSDIYALGMTLAEFLSGRSPELATGATPTTAPTWPSRASPPSRANPTIDRELDGIILRAIDPDPSKRFQHVQELSTRLSNWLAFHTSLPARLAELRRSWVRGTSLLLLRSRVLGTGVVALLAALIAFASTPLLFNWTSAAVLTQAIPNTAATVDRLSTIRMIDGSDYPALLAACKRQGIHIDLNKPGDMRLAWAAIARKLASVGPIRAVGFDLFFITPHAADADFKKALLTLAEKSDCKCVVLAMGEWHEHLTPGLQDPAWIRVATARLNKPSATQPPFAHLALRRSGDELAAPSFALALAGAHQRPGSAMRISVSRLDSHVLVTFETQSPSGALIRGGTDEMLLAGQRIQQPDAFDGVGFAEGDMIARLPILVPTEAAIAECTKSAAEVLEMPAEMLRLWIGQRAVMIAGKEDHLPVGGRAISPAYLNASVVESLATREMMRLPGIPGAFGITVLAAIFGALLGWFALAISDRWPRLSLRILTTAVILTGVFVTGLGCVALMRGALVFANPIVPCLAVTLAVLAVTILERASRAHLGTDP